MALPDKNQLLGIKARPHHSTRPLSKEGSGETTQILGSVPCNNMCGRGQGFTQALVSSSVI